MPASDSSVIASCLVFVRQPVCLCQPRSAHLDGLNVRDKSVSPSTDSLNVRSAIWVFPKKFAQMVDPFVEIILFDNGVWPNLV